MGGDHINQGVTTVPFRAALIGAGRHVVRTMWPAIRAVGWDVQAVCTRSARSAETAKLQLGVDFGYGSVDQLLERHAHELDAAVVVVPPAEYRGLACRCLNAGLPVLCEKPGGQSPAELADVEEMSARAGKPVMVGFMKRFAPAYVRGREVTQRPEFGPVLGYQGSWGTGTVQSDLYGWLADVASHAIDLARYFMGELVNPSVRTISIGARHVLSVTFTSESTSAVVGMELTSALSWDYASERVTVTGAGGRVVVDDLVACRYYAPNSPESRWSTAFTAMRGDVGLNVTGFVGCLSHFERVVRFGEPCLSDVASARRTMELIREVYDLSVVDA